MNAKRGMSRMLLPHIKGSDGCGISVKQQRMKDEYHLEPK